MTTDFVRGAKRARKTLRKRRTRTVKKLAKGIKRRRKTLARRRARVPSVLG